MNVEKDRGCSGAEFSSTAACAVQGVLAAHNKN